MMRKGFLKSPDLSTTQDSALRGRIALPVKDARRPIKDAGGTPKPPWRINIFFDPRSTIHDLPLRPLATFAPSR
jgi:hypothetical protein